MKSRLLLAVATLAMLANSAGWAGAQQAAARAAETSPSTPPPSTASRLPEVDITARRGELEPKVFAFVNQITRADSDEGLAQWSERICPLVSGLARDDSEFILGRVSEIARAAGAPLAGEHCRANLYILVSKEPAELLRAMQRRNPSFTFGHVAPRVIDEFIATPRPVRVWYHTMERTPEGMPLIYMSFPDMNHVGAESNPRNDSLKHFGPEPGAPGFKTNPWSKASRLQLNVIWTIYRAFVVVDQTRLQGVSRQQLADYVAMVALAQLNAEARLGDAPTILTLFNQTPQAARPGMSAWDAAFLKSLYYETQQKSRLQRGQIALSMVRTIAPE
jgi:hypothetical protein